MRIANLNGRAVIVDADGAIDIAEASGGQFGHTPQAVFDDWEKFVTWSEEAALPKGRPYDVVDFGAPSPTPRQVFAIGLNYRDHAAESAMDAPASPSVFTKFQSSISGPDSIVDLPRNGHVDWEVELVVIIGRAARHATMNDAWAHVAGLTIGQDLSERLGQLAGGVPQFSLGKSHPGFAPMGPVLVTIDEFDDPNDLAISCLLDDEVVQQARTSAMIHSVPALIEHLSGVLPLMPGDVIFTGTPSGVGFAREPKRKIQPGQVLLSRIDGIGEIRQSFR